MSSLWPWLAVAGAGALHGLNPAAGWLMVAGCGLHSGDRRQALRALVPIATGHAVSIAVVAAAVALGHSMEEWARPVMGTAAVVLLALFCRRSGCRSRVGTASHSPSATGRIGMVLWSFVASTAHGSGMMLVPALVPLCLGDSPAREITASGSLTLALAAVALHALAMLGTLGLVATAALRVFAAARRATQSRPGAVVEDRCPQRTIARRAIGRWTLAPLAVQPSSLRIQPSDACVDTMAALIARTYNQRSRRP
jgi:hypothetical protein